MIIFRLIGESFRFAFDALRQNKLRTMLSLLAITIGIFVIIAVFSAVDTFRAKLQTSVDKLGSNTLYIQKWPWIFSDNFAWWKYINRPTPSYRDFNALKERLENVKGITYDVTASGRTVKYRSNSLDGVSITAATMEYNKTWNFDFEEGRYFTESEHANGSPICILGYTIANNLFDGESAIGKQIKLMGRRVTVVGVFKKEGEDMMGISQDELVLIPLSFGRSIIDVNSERYNPQITVRGLDEISLAEMESEVTAKFRAVRGVKPGAEDNFAINKATMITKQLDSLFDMVNIAGWVIGGFSILVGGFSIANIMFVSVKERTNLIGIQKSLGAKNYFILLQFIFESVLLCILGGLFGLLLVQLLLWVLQWAADVKIVIDIYNVMLGIGISITIGVISGFWPAYSASKLDPVEAIRS